MEMFPSLEILESTLGKSMKLNDLYVSWVFIAFIACNLDFLQDPFLEVICISYENLVVIGIFKLLTPLSNQFLEPPVPGQHLLTPLLDLFCCFQHFWPTTLHSLQVKKLLHIAGSQISSILSFYMSQGIYSYWTYVQISLSL